MEFLVDPKALKRSADQLQHVHSGLKQASEIVGKVAKSLDTTMEPYAIVASRLKSYDSSVSKAGKKAAQMQSGLEQAANMYRKTESDIVGKKVNGSKIGAIARITAPVMIPIGKTGSKGKITCGLLQASTAAKAVAVADDKKGDVYLKGEAKAEVAAASVKYEYDDGKSSVNAEAKALTGAATGSISATLYKNGVLDPSIEAKVKAEGALLAGSVKSRVGSENNNIHAAAKGAIGYAAAEAGLKLGKDGFKAKAGAEAYAAKGSIKGGFTFMGIKFNGTIEGKAGGAGVGAMAKAEKSAVSGEIGAGLGLGLGIKLEIDWSGFNWKSGKKGSWW